MKNKNIFAVVDTETVGLEGEIYDFAYAITDKHGKIYSKNNHLVKETYTNGDKMTSAYYTKRAFTHYALMLDRQEIKLKSWNFIRDQFLADLETYNVNILTAYNLGFDSRAIRTTHKLLTGESKFLHYKPRLLCLWEFACRVLLSHKLYARLAKQENWISDAGNMRTTAEHAFRYATGELDFIEQHTAAADVEAEITILQRCLEQKKKIPYGIMNNSPWRYIN